MDNGIFLIKPKNSNLKKSLMLTFIIIANLIFYKLLLSVFYINWIMKNVYFYSAIEFLQKDNQQ